MLYVALLNNRRNSDILIPLLLSLFSMKLTCPECKNDVDLSVYPNLQKNQVVECGMCGITLLVTDINGDVITVEIVDEGK